MEKLMMRDGRVYSLASVLEKLKSRKSTERIHDVKEYFNNLQST